MGSCVSNLERDENIDIFDGIRMGSVCSWHVSKLLCLELFSYRFPAVVDIDLNGRVSLLELREWVEEEFNIGNEFM